MEDQFAALRRTSKGFAGVSNSLLILVTSSLSNRSRAHARIRGPEGRYGRLGRVPGAAAAQKLPDFHARFQEPDFDEAAAATGAWEPRKSTTHSIRSLAKVAAS